MSILLSVWPGSLDAIKWGGATFLAWLGFSSLYRAARYADGGIQMNLDLGAASPRSHAGLYFGDGLAINLLSPVIISFYLSVVPTFIPDGASPFYYAGLAATHVTLALACHAMWATALGLMRRFFIAPWTRRMLQAGAGVALITLAVRVLTVVLVFAAVFEAQPTDRVPVLAELFTSHGCNRCPPQVERDAELWFAIAEVRLVIDVKRGENANKTLRRRRVVAIGSAHIAAP